MGSIEISLNLKDKESVDKELKENFLSRYNEIIISILDEDDCVLYEYQIKKLKSKDKYLLTRSELFRKKYNFNKFITTYSEMNILKKILINNGFIIDFFNNEDEDDYNQIDYSKSIKIDNLLNAVYEIDHLYNKIKLDFDNQIKEYSLKLSKVLED